MELNIDFRNIKKHQAVIIAMAAVAIVLILVFWLFVYNPARNKMKDLNAQLNTLESEIKKIEAVAGGGQLDKAYTEFYRKYTALDARIPREEKAILGALSTEANKMNIEVASVKPDKIRDSGLAAKIDGKDMKAMDISMHVICDYVTLGEYLKVLRDSMPALISVNFININGPAKEGGRVDITLKMTLYLLLES